ncbi:MAG: hypothetical protein IKI75_09020 [Lachnospiraceae bacterium]|nr:hypothetical protein [Lachnospiraceae bacterium]
MKFFGKKRSKALVLFLSAVLLFTDGGGAFTQRVYADEPGKEDTGCSVEAENDIQDDDEDETEGLSIPDETEDTEEEVSEEAEEAIEEVPPYQYDDNALPYEWEEDPYVEDLTEEDADPDEEAAQEEEFIDTGRIFEISGNEIPYGQDGSNAEGQLDAVFRPVVIMDGKKLEAGSDYTVEYRFFTTAREAGEVKTGSFHETTGIELSEAASGSHIYVVAMATVYDYEKRFLARCEADIVKRALKLSLVIPEDAAIDGRDIPEDGLYVIPEGELSDDMFVLDAGEGFAGELPDPLSFISGDITLDMSEVDVSEDSHSTNIPVMVDIPEETGDYSVDGNVFGNVYSSKARYYVTFRANVNEHQFNQSFEIPSYEFIGPLTDIEDALEVFEGPASLDQWILENDDSEGKTAVLGWSVYTDGKNQDLTYANSGPDGGWPSPVLLNPDGVTYETVKPGEEPVTNDFVISGGHDYLFVAQISKAAAKNIFVTTIPAVTYDTREHQAIGEKGVDLKKESADLRIAVYSSYEGDAGKADVRLVLNRDYSLSYYNNRDASMKLDEEGRFVPRYTGSYYAERPYVEVTGTGKYTGFSARAYFDILPADLGENEYMYETVHDPRALTDNYNEDQEQDLPYTYVGSYRAELSGMKGSTLLLTGGRITNRVNPKVVKRFYESGCYLKNGKPVYRNRNNYNTAVLSSADYETEIYRWDTENECWEPQYVNDPNYMSSAGRYLYLIRGKGNYCGSVYGRYSFNAFNDGKDKMKSPAVPALDPSDPFQFAVEESYEHDMAFGSMKVAHTKLPYTEGVLRGGDDFGITVYGMNGSLLTEGVDYTLRFDGKYGHVNGTNSGEKVSAANSYSVSAIGKGEYYGVLTKAYGTVKIKGINLKSKFFEIPPGYRTWQVTGAGRASGITRDDKNSPYYVDSRSYTELNIIKYFIGGIWEGDLSSYTGEAINPVSMVKMHCGANAAPEKFTMKRALAEGYIGFRVSQYGDYNIGGSYPDSITLWSRLGGGKAVDVMTWYADPCSEDDDHLIYNDMKTGYVTVYNGYYNTKESFTIQFSDNMKTGGTATVSVKAKGEVFSGKAEAGTYKVRTLKVKSINNGKSGNDRHGDIVAVITDRSAGSGNLSRPRVTFCQAYRVRLTQSKNLTTTSEIHYAVLSKDQYTKYTAPLSKKNIAADIMVRRNPAGSDLDFGEGLEAGVFALYADRIQAKNISAVTIDGVRYPVRKRKIRGTEFPFEGGQVRPVISSVEMKDGTVLKLGEDYDLSYGENLTAGTGGGKISFRMHYNREKDSYRYGGKTTIGFDIGVSPKVKL